MVGRGQNTLFKCTIKCFLVYSQNCATITTINFGTFSSSPKEAPYLFTVTPFSLSHQPLPISNLLSVAIDLSIWNVSYFYEFICGWPAPCLPFEIPVLLWK